MSNDARRGKRLFAGFLAAVMALSVAPVLGFTGVAGADEHLEAADPIGEGNFCEDVPDDNPFTDVTAADPSYEEILCLVATEVTTGVTATTYEPNSFVTRRQMALFLTRVAAEANRLEIDDNIEELPEPAANEFDDVEDEEQFIQDAISQISQAGIAEGFPDGDYRPAAPVSRRQMAAFIDRLYEYLTGEALPAAAEDNFSDDNEDSDEAQASTNAVAEAGIFIGNADGTFAPAQEITRRQMANVLTRTFEVLFENGEITQWAEEDVAATTATIRPELVSAAIVETVTVGNATPTKPAGTYVRYTFDEAVGSSLPSDVNHFQVYSYDRSIGETAATSVAVEPGGMSVVARFANVNTAAAASTLTVATVDDNAVFDANGLGNPEGDAAIGSGSSTTLVAGTTAAPDLVSVGNFRQGQQVGTTAVDFTFDQAATVVGTTGFNLVTTQGAVSACASSSTAGAPSGGTVPGGSGTTVITVVCLNPGGTAGLVAGTPLTAGNVARGYVDDGAVNSGAPLNRANPLQAADVANSGNSTDPDLVSATFVPGSTASAPDRVIFTFDQAIASAMTPTSDQFAVYTNAGTEIAAAGVAPVISSTNPTQVLVTFGANALDSAVGANVEPGAVTATAATGGTTNEADEVGVANSNTSASTPGFTAGPDLTGVEIIPTDGFNPTRARYTFDETLANSGGAPTSTGAFWLWLSDGTRIGANACVVGATGSTAATQTVTCTFTAANATLNTGVLGTVDAGAVTEEIGSLTNVEGAEVTTGGSGTPAA